MTSWRRVARELGATHAFDPSASDTVTAVREVSGGGADAVIECAGVPETFRTASGVLQLDRLVTRIIGLDAVADVVASAPEAGERRPMTWLTLFLQWLFRRWTLVGRFC
jgi:Zn-dependent alcohol dehydrogenase